MSITQKLTSIIQKNNSLVCVGLDSDIEKLPEQFKNSSNGQFEFNRAIIDATHDLVCAYKPNTAFYEGAGAEGIVQLKKTCDYLRANYPEIVIILDAKRGDIGNTNNGYVEFAFDFLSADAITVHPYLGKESLQPFLDRTDKATIVLCRTSNPGAGELQHLKVDGEELYKHVARKVATEWNTNKNCMLVVGATNPEQIAEVRKIAGKDIVLLIPGIGAQGGDIEKTVLAGKNKNGTGMIINSSRGIIFASGGEDFAKKTAEETEKLRSAINSYR